MTLQVKVRKSNQGIVKIMLPLKPVGETPSLYLLALGVCQQFSALLGLQMHCSNLSLCDHMAIFSLCFYVFLVWSFCIWISPPYNHTSHFGLGPTLMISSQIYYISKISTMQHITLNKLFLVLSFSQLFTASSHCTFLPIN